MMPLWSTHKKHKSLQLQGFLLIRHVWQIILYGDFEEQNMVIKIEVAAVMILALKTFIYKR